MGNYVYLIEAVLVFGGIVAFGYWQLRDVKKAREKTKAQSDKLDKS